MEDRYITRCYKRLKNKGLPLSGWSCVEVIDTGVDTEVCELCNCQQVRFIHVMKNDECDKNLNVGCICAGVMEGDILAAKERERIVANKAKRQESFSKKKWSKVGFDTYKTSHRHHTVIIQRVGSSIGVKVDGLGFHWGFANSKEAKNKAFEIMENLDYGTRAGA